MLDKIRNTMLTFRALEPQDIDLLYNVENDCSMWQCATTNAPYSRYALGQYIATCLNDVYQDGQLRLVVEQDGRMVGMVDLIDFNAQHQRAEVGIIILPMFRGKGLGKRALQMLEAYVGQHCPLHQLYAYVATDNLAAISLFRLCNYDIEHQLKDWLRVAEGVYKDVYLIQKIL